MKRAFCVGAGIIIFIAFVLSILMAQPENIVINNTGIYKVKERSPVSFPHGLHMESDLSCTDCHHWYRSDGKNILDESKLEEGKPGIKCSDCHKRKGRSRLRYNLREAFHMQCMGCHGKLKKEGKKSGPRLCGECHPWK